MIPLRTMLASALECPVCLTLPNGEVHQCNEGHTVCIDCWRRIDPRCCPECRQLLPQSNRCRAAERAIAALDAACEHCGEATKRGEMAAHLRACPQRHSGCAAAAAGCGWEGVASELGAHEMACPFAICLRMVEPLRSECKELRARVAALEPLRAQNERLQRQVAALGHVSEAEEEDAATGGQHFGAMATGPPPSNAEVTEMELAEIVAALRAHVAVARVAEQAFTRLKVLCEPPGSEQAAAEAGAIEAVVAAMQTHSQVAGVQVPGCRILRNVCFGSDAAGLARSHRAAEAGALEAVLAAMRAHPQVADVQVEGCSALVNVRNASDAAGLARSHRAAEAGALEVLVAAMRAHSQAADVQVVGCSTLIELYSGGANASALACRRHATQAGGRTVAIAAMQAHAGHGAVQRFGQRVLDCFPE